MATQGHFNFFGLPREIRDLMYHQILANSKDDLQHKWSKQMFLPAYYLDWSPDPDCTSFHDLWYQFRQRVQPEALPDLLEVDPRFALELGEEAARSGLPATLEIGLRTPFGHFILPVNIKRTKKMPSAQWSIERLGQPLRNCLTSVRLYLPQFERSRLCELRSDELSVLTPFLTVTSRHLLASLPHLQKIEIQIACWWYAALPPYSREDCPPVRCLDLPCLDHAHRPRWCPGTGHVTFQLPKKRLEHWLSEFPEPPEGVSESDWVVSFLNYGEGDYVRLLPW